MNSDEEWDYVNGDGSSKPAGAGSGLLRISLLFGSVAVAFALFLVPVLNKTGMNLGNEGDIDRILTGSVSKPGTEYTLRRSVLQRDPSAFCVVRNGSAGGNC